MKELKKSDIDTMSFKELSTHLLTLKQLYNLEKSIGRSDIYLNVLRTKIEEAETKLKSITGYEE